MKFKKKRFKFPSLTYDLLIMSFFLNVQNMTKKMKFYERQPGFLKPIYVFMLLCYSIIMPTSYFWLVICYTYHIACCCCCCCLSSSILMWPIICSLWACFEIQRINGNFMEHQLRKRRQSKSTTNNIQFHISAVYSSSNIRLPLFL